MKLRLHHVLLVTVGATLLLSNAVILFVGFQQRSADIQKAYHDHFHLTSKVFAYRSFFVIQGGTTRQLPYFLSGLLTDQIYYYVITDTNKKVLVSSFDSEKRLSDQPLSTWSQGRIELTQNVIISSKDQSYGIQKMVGRLRSFRPGTLTSQLESMIHNERVYEVEVEFGDKGKLDVLDTHAAFMYIGFQEYDSSLLEYLNDYRIFLNLFFTILFILFFFIRFQWLVFSSNEPVTTISEQISTKDKKDDSQEICDASENFGSKTHHSAYRGDSATPRCLQKFSG